MRVLRPIALFSLLLAQQLWAQPERPIKRPPNNQLVLEGPDAPAGRVDSPAAVAGIANRLTFHVSPLSAKGLLSQQVEDALKALDKANGNATILKLRAFVAGTGDLRRVQTIVNDLFTQKKLPLPVISTVQVGALPLEGAQVVIESVSEDRRPTNTGLRFVPMIEGGSGAEAMAKLRAALGADALRITCFADSLAEAQAARSEAAKVFPKTPAVFVQTTRYTLGPHVACEGVLSGPAGARLIFAAPQLAFGDQDEDLKLAFERLDKALEPFQARVADAALANAYTTSKAVADKAAALGAKTSVFVEGLSSRDATLAVEAVIPAN